MRKNLCFKLKQLSKAQQTEKVVISTTHKHTLPSPYIKVNGKIFNLQFKNQLNLSQMLISNKTKLFLFGMNDIPQTCQICSYQAEKQDELEVVTIYLYYQSKKNQAKKQFSKPELKNRFICLFNSYFVNNQQVLSFTFKKYKFDARIEIQSPKQYGFITNNTKINFKPELSQNFTLTSLDQSNHQQDSGANPQQDQSYKQKLKKIKAGGLSQQINLIARRIFSSRKFGGSLAEKLGINHAKGLLLYGPPGTGKTLLAREMSKVLDVEPTIINGPQIMNKYVGEGQRRLRQIFQPAIQQYKLKGNQSSLHVLIFDQIDSIAKKRGGSDSSIGDSLVNQLLTLIDGVDSPKNILVIGITNRKDLIDEALLRSGRLEVHVEVFLPNQQGRKEIFDIHLRLMNKEGILDEDVSSQMLSKITKNYTGAQIQSLVKSSFSLAIEQAEHQGKNIKNLSQIIVKKRHFLKARQDIKPQFGQDENQIESLLPSIKINLQNYMPEVYKNLQQWIQKYQNTTEGILTLLIKGPPRTGKTALALQCCKKIDMPFTKIITSGKIYQLSQAQKIQYLIKVIQDAKRCRQSCIVLDDILRLIEYVPLTSKYNNSILQLIVNMVQPQNQKKKKKVIIATCNSVNYLQDLGIKWFEDILEIPMLRKTVKNKIIQQYWSLFANRCIKPSLNLNCPPKDRYPVDDTLLVLQRTKRLSIGRMRRNSKWRQKNTLQSEQQQQQKLGGKPKLFNLQKSSQMRNSIQREKEFYSIGDIVEILRQHQAGKNAHRLLYPRFSKDDDV